MPRFRRRAPRMSMKGVTSLKMQHGRAQSDIAGVRNNFSLLFGIKPGQARVTGTEAAAGSHVYSFDLYINAIVDSGGGNSNFDCYVIFLRDGQTISTSPEADFTDIGLSPRRNQIIYSDLNQLGSEDAGPLRRKIHIKVPKLYQRIRESDLWVFVYGHSANIQTNLGFRAKNYS